MAGMLKGLAIKAFFAFQDGVTQRSSLFSPQERTQSLALIERALEKKSKVVKIKILFFLILLQLVSILKTGKLFNYLPPDKKYKILYFFYDSPLPLFRKGFWGLNTLARLGVYGQENLYPEWHYQVRKND